MKSFFTSVVTAVIIAVGAMYALDAVWQRQADQAFITGSSVRLPDHGNTHNLVGKTWYSTKDHAAGEQHWTGEKQPATVLASEDSMSAKESARNSYQQPGDLQGYVPGLFARSPARRFAETTMSNAVIAPEHLELRIGGMTCAHCPPAIEKALTGVAGVSAAHVNPATKTAWIDYDRSRTTMASLLKTIRGIGYTVGTATTRIPIKNMHCSSCVVRIELALRTAPGVVTARASLGPNAVDIGYDPERVDFEAIRNAIETAGYRVAEPKIDPKSENLDPAEAANEQEYRSLMRKFWFAAAVSIP